MAWGRRGRCPPWPLRPGRTCEGARLCKWNQSREWMGLFLDRRAAHKEGDRALMQGPQCPLLSKPQPPTSAGEKGVHPKQKSLPGTQATCCVCPAR